MLRLPGALARPVDRRIRAVNAVVDAVADRHGTLHLDTANHPLTYDRRMLWGTKMPLPRLGWAFTRRVRTR